MEVGVELEEAVANERTPHSQQLIQKTSSNNTRNFYCTCSSCYRNGNYVIQEGRSWVSASESAVEYYMDPLNFLDERYIFQFETTAYSSAQTTAGIETIIKNTWMYNSLITYKDSSGTTRTYTSSASERCKILAGNPGRGKRKRHKRILPCLPHCAGSGRKNQFRRRSQRHKLHISRHL